MIGIDITDSYLKVSEEAQTARGSDTLRLETVYQCIEPRFKINYNILHII